MKDEQEEVEEESEKWVMLEETTVTDGYSACVCSMTETRIRGVNSSKSSMGGSVEGEEEEDG